MRDLGKQERAAIEAVARHLSATLELGSDFPDAGIVIGGKRVAVDIATLKRRDAAEGNNAAKLRLRFDKVATKLVERLQVAVSRNVPDGILVLLTITAPIRLPSKTAALLEEKIQTLLAGRLPCRDEQETIHGNRVRIRFFRDESERAPKLIGFVHNPDSDPALLLNMTCELLELISVESAGRAPKAADERWLVVIGAGESSRLEAYRYIVSQLHKGTGFKKILMPFSDGSVGTLTG